MQENPLRPVAVRFPALKKDARTDIVVVGGGITGVLCGHFLQEAGYQTIVLEQDEVGGGASGASSGILYYGTGTNLIPAMKLWGKETAGWVWQETAQNVKELAALAEDLDCGLRRPGAIMLAKSEKEAQLLKQEHKELSAIGLNHSLLSPKEVKQFFPAVPFAAGLHFEDCAQLYPAQFAGGLAKKMNIPVYEHTKAVDAVTGARGVTVKTERAVIAADYVIVATNDYPFPPEKSWGLERSFVQQNSVIAASQKVSAAQRKAYFPEEKIGWTMEEDYDLFYPHEGRLLFEVYALKGLKEKLAAYYPGFAFTRDKQWGTSWGRCTDWLPLAGRLKNGIFVAAATGDQGTTTGYTIAKHAVAMAEGKKNRWLELCDPKRYLPGGGKAKKPEAA